MISIYKSIAFGRKFSHSFRMNIFPKSFWPKWSFVKLIPEITYPNGDIRVGRLVDGAFDGKAIYTEVATATGIGPKPEPEGRAWARDV
jgi:hypothetical protein